MGRQLGAEHSQRLESYFQSIPGVQLVACSTVANAKALLKSAIRSDNPIIFFEHVLLYNVKGALHTALLCCHCQAASWECMATHYHGVDGNCSQLKGVHHQHCLMTGTDVHELSKVRRNGLVGEPACRLLTIAAEGQLQHVGAPLPAGTGHRIDVPSSQSLHDAGETKEGYYQPLEKAELVRAGKDVTILCYSRMRYVVMQAVQQLEKMGYDPEVHAH